jgi:hypothetical protein
LDGWSCDLTATTVDGMLSPVRKGPAENRAANLIQIGIEMFSDQAMFFSHELLMKAEIIGGK